MRDAVGDRVAVTAKLNMSDGVRGGLEIDESIAVAQMLEYDGRSRRADADGRQLTREPDVPLPRRLADRGDGADHAAHDAHGLQADGAPVHALLPLRGAYFLPMARRYRDALAMPLVLLGGINRLGTITNALDEGFAFVAMARALLCEPDLVNRMRTDASTEAACIHCNKCMPTIYRGTRCVITEPLPVP